MRPSPLRAVLARVAGWPTTTRPNPLVLCLLLGAALLPLASGCGDSDSSGGEGSAEGVPLPGTVPVAAPEPDDCFVDPSAGRKELACEGLTFRLNVPPVCLERACGLIADIHGLEFSAAEQDLHTELATRGGEAGFIVLQPDGPRAVALPGMPRGWSPENDSQVLALIERVMRTYHVLESRVHMTGFSLGGHMIWRFACTQADLLASVAPLAAGREPTVGCFTDALPSRELAVLYAHGTADGVLGFAGAAPVVEGARTAWGLDDASIVSQDGEHIRTRYTNDAGAVFEFIEHDWTTDHVGTLLPAFQGHCFPGSGELVGCGADNAIHWGAAVVEFFLEHPRD